ncbi:MAG: hypothetical protein WC657_01865 [Candidatus Paceibacterota bacterium]|jgi:hypothetical protein
MQTLPDIFGWFTFSGEALADLLFFVMAAFTAGVSLVLFFHWRRYGMGGSKLAFTELIYLVVAVALLATAFFALN